MKKRKLTQSCDPKITWREDKDSEHTFCSSFHQSQRLRVHPSDKFHSPGGDEGYICASDELSIPGISDTVGRIHKCKCREERRVPGSDVKVQDDSTSLNQIVVKRAHLNNESSPEDTVQSTKVCIDTFPIQSFQHSSYG